MPRFHQEEFEPPERAVDLTIDEVAIPLLQELVESADHHVQLVVELHVGPKSIRKVRTIGATTSKGTETTTGIIQLRFRPGFESKRILFCLAAVFEGEVLSNSGFTGFHTSGEIHELTSAKRRGWTGVYNDHAWPGWLW
jgi:hypothetical protein